jgi:4a-hydroxytetrahydrobiopterin dehydratase
VTATEERFSPENATRRLRKHPGWVVERTRIYRDFRLPSFVDAMAMVNRVAAIAEAQQHHPNILLHDWCFVRLELYTHSENAVSEKDVDLALAIDAALDAQDS